MANGIHYLKEVVAVDRDRVDEAFDLLQAGPPGEEVPASARQEPTLIEDEEFDALVLGEFSIEDVNDETGEALARLRAMVGLIRVEEPLRAAEFLQSENVESGPIHAVGFEGHAGFMPGTDHDDADPAFRLPDAGLSRSDPIIAVVDTGIVKNRPDWLTDVIHDDPEDIEHVPANRASHGTFVVGTIRQISPRHEISIARARERDIEEFELKPEDPNHQNVPPYPTSEIDVAFALCRLTVRHENEPRNVAALNLSLGAYTKDPAHMVTLRKALNKWRAVYGGPDDASGPLEQGIHQIFAAGGNQPGAVPVYPGAYPDVRAVGATACGESKQFVWDRTKPGNPPTPNPARNWITDVAPGADICGLKGHGDLVTKWSGSSFATAVATASYMNGAVPYRVVNGIVWWGRDNGTADCALIPNLVVNC